MVGSSDIPRACFVPLQSALDYADPSTIIADDLNIGTQPVALNFSRTKADVIVGWRTDNANFGNNIFSSFYKWDYEQGLKTRNSYHIDWRIDFIGTSVFPPHEFTKNYLCREIGDSLMLLDNMLINRNARYSASDRIISGFEANLFYKYDGISGSNFLKEMQSRTNPFVIESFDIGRVEFKAAKEIVLKAGFECKRGGRYWAHIDSLFYCKRKFSQLFKRNLGGPPNYFVSNNEQNIADKNQTSILYPNPNTGSFTFYNPTNAIKLYKLYDNKGTLIHIETLNTPLNTIEIKKNLKSGVYVIQVMDILSNFETKRFICITN